MFPSSTKQISRSSKSKGSPLMQVSKSHDGYQSSSQNPQDNKSSFHLIKDCNPAQFLLNSANAAKGKDIDFEGQSSEKNASPMNTEDLISDILSTQVKRLQIKKRNQKMIEKSKIKKNLEQEFSKQMNRTNEQSLSCSDKSHNQAGESYEMDSDTDSLNNESSSQFGQKRVRKNRDQIQQLQVAFDQSGGYWTKQQQKVIAHQLGLSEQQVYKWSWDQLQKRKRFNSGMSCTIVSDKSQCTDEFGGYSKSWLGGKNSQNSTAEQTSQMTDECIIESISQLIGLDIEQKAKEIISKASPNGRRQIAKPVKQIPPLQNFKIPKTVPIKIIQSSPPQDKANKSNSPSSENIEVKCFEEIVPSNMDDEMSDISQQHAVQMSNFIQENIKKTQSIQKQDISRENTDQFLISPNRSEAMSFSQISFADRHEPKMTISAATAFSFTPQRQFKLSSQTPNSKGFSLLQSLQKDRTETATDVNKLIQQSGIDDNKEQEEYLDQELPPLLNKPMKQQSSTQIFNITSSISPHYIPFSHEGLQNQGTINFYNFYQQQATPINVLNSAKSNKPFSLSPSPNIFKPFQLFYH